MAKSKQNKGLTTTIRVPVDLHRRLQARADLEERALGVVVVRILSSGLDSLDVELEAASK